MKYFYKPLMPVTVVKLAINSLDAGGAVKCSSSNLKLLGILE